MDEEKSGCLILFIIFIIPIFLINPQGWLEVLSTNTYCIDKDYDNFCEAKNPISSREWGKHLNYSSGHLNKDAYVNTLNLPFIRIRKIFL